MTLTPFYLLYLNVIIARLLLFHIPRCGPVQLSALWCYRSSSQIGARQRFHRISRIYLKLYARVISTHKTINPYLRNLLIILGLHQMNQFSRESFSI